MSDLDDYQMPESYGSTVGKCLTYEEIEALLAAERERCAKVADSFNAKWWSQVDCQPTTKLAAWYRGRSGGAMKLAAAIRNLPPELMGGEAAGTYQPEGMPTASKTDAYSVID